MEEALEKGLLSCCFTEEEKTSNYGQCQTVEVDESLLIMN